MPKPIPGSSRLGFQNQKGFFLSPAGHHLSAFNKRDEIVKLKLRFFKYGISTYC